MKYASTTMNNGIETVVVVMELFQVPAFDPRNPPQPYTYGVNDDVQVGWIKNDQGTFVPPNN